MRKTYIKFSNYLRIRESNFLIYYHPYNSHLIKKQRTRRERDPISSPAAIYMVVVRSGKEKKKLEDFYRKDLLEDFYIFAQAALFVIFFPQQMFDYHEKVSLGILHH